MMTILDADELMFLAMDASKKGDREKAITNLKLAIETNPTAESLYLLAAEYAELGMYERAIAGMKNAIELNPKLDSAKFQLGLLLLISQQIDKARNAWQEMSETAHEPAFNTLGKGLTLIIDGKKEEGKILVEEAIQLNQSNQPLNKDIVTLMEQLGVFSNSQTESTSDDNEINAMTYAVQAYNKE